ncbi:MAG: S-methyl-5'-thioadenosine phosphorylase [Chloroflexota bacterium]|nr:S-methyl-5'-thioadenosine phosphorylase [Chloroflexota bacterium]
MGRLGVVGGSGFYHLPELAESEVIAIATPYGAPSGDLRLGVIGQTEVVFVPRHGPGHSLSPAKVPYRANIYALKALGVSHLISISAVGSLRHELPPRSAVLPDQIIDRTVDRDRTFFDGGVVAHVGLADPFCGEFRARIEMAATRVNQPVHPGGTYICIEGPQFSTRAESRLYRTWDGSVIGMTAMPEARLAREAELCYATLAMVTDYDVWHDTEGDVSVELVHGHLRANLDTSAAILRSLGGAGLPDRRCDCGSALAHAMMSSPDCIGSDDRERLGVIAERYVRAPAS